MTFLFVLSAYRLACTPSQMRQALQTLIEVVTMTAMVLRDDMLTLRNIRENVAIALITIAMLLLGVCLGRVHMAGGTRLLRA